MQQAVLESSPRLGSYLPCPTPTLREALAHAGSSTGPRKRLGGSDGPRPRNIRR